MSYTDDLILDSIKKSRDGIEEPDALAKAMNKAGLVQKEVQVKGKNGQVFTRKQWVKASEDQPADKPTKKQDDEKAHPKGNEEDLKIDFGKRDKQALVSLLQSGASRENIMAAAEKQGITWKKSDHAGINWMRCSMAITGTSTKGESKNAATDKESSSNDASAKVGVEDLSASKTSSKKDESKIDKSSPYLQGISTDCMSDYEKRNFGKVLEAAAPEDLRNFRTLGMCGADAESTAYLARLYKDYSQTLQGMSGTSVPKYDPNIDPDSLRNTLQGVVNKMVVGVVKSSLSNVRKRTTQFTLQEKLLEPWVDPNVGVTAEQKQQIKKLGGGQQGSERQRYMTESDSSHVLMKRFLDKLALTQEYGDAAKEYKSILEQYDKLTENNRLLQVYTNTPTTPNSILSSLKYNHAHSSELWQKAQLEKAQVDDEIQSGKIVPEWRQKLVEQNYERYKRKLEEAQYFMDNFTSPAELDNLVEASRLRASLFDKKFVDINANLWHFKQIGAQLAFQYDITKDFVADYPILSSSDIDKLESGDEKALTNLSLFAGMFKPSLSKNGEDAKSQLLQKFKERQDFLNTYGGVSAVTNSTGYSENNEVKCQVSKVSDKVYKSISNDIARDWDKKNHGGMRYKIKGIYEVSGLAVEKEFESIKKSHSSRQRKSPTLTSQPKNQTSDMFYHGTGAMATSLILGHSGEFKVGKAKVGRMLGDGIYLADKSSKSAQYISDSGYSRKGISGSLMIVEASLGSVTSRGDRRNWDAYDTVFAGTQDRLLNNEWCVHNPKAVIPRYLVEMEVL